MRGGAVVSTLTPLAFSRSTSLLDAPRTVDAGSAHTYQGQMELGADHLLGVWVDELGIEQVRLYRIEKE